MAAIARRDHVALAEAHRRHAAAVHALARHLVGTGAFAEEVVQEVFLRLWDPPGRFDPSRGSLRAYLRTQSHGRSRDLLRAEIARHEREARDVRRAPRATDDLEHHVVDLTTAEQVREVMNDLPDRERAAIELAYLGGMLLPRGRCAPRTARGHGEEPHPHRAAEDAQEPGQRGLGVHSRRLTTRSPVIASSSVPVVCSPPVEQWPAVWEQVCRRWRVSRPGR